MSRSPVFTTFSINAILAHVFEFLSIQIYIKMSSVKWRPVYEHDALVFLVNKQWYNIYSNYPVRFNLICKDYVSHSQRGRYNLHFKTRSLPRIQYCGSITYHLKKRYHLTNQSSVWNYLNFLHCRHLPEYMILISDEVLEPAPLQDALVRIKIAFPLIVKVTKIICQSKVTIDVHSIPENNLIYLLCQYCLQYRVLSVNCKANVRCKKKQVMCQECLKQDGVVACQSHPNEFYHISCIPSLSVDIDNKCHSNCQQKGTIYCNRFTLVQAHEVICGKPNLSNEAEYHRRGLCYYCAIKSDNPAKCQCRFSVHNDDKDNDDVIEKSSNESTEPYKRIKLS